jgi:SAM-dependent methyltransferase
MAHPSAQESLVETLHRQDAAWSQRPLVRRLYRQWYGDLVARLARVDGKSIELGSGIGRLQDVAGTRVTLTDVEQTPWTDVTVDALALPYGDRSLANIVMLDVFHHLADPARFLDEARRVLVPGGRVLMIEPYCSPASTPLYRRFHEERTDLAVDPFSADGAIAETPFESNQALPTLAFFRRREELRRRWPELRLVEERRFSFVLYPLSGGFSKPPLVPSPLIRPLELLERCLQPLAPLLAFRCLVVLEKRS